MLKSRLDDYATSTAQGLARAVAQHEVSALELFDEAVRTIEAKDPALNAVVVRDFDRAREAAKAADAALARGESGPLLGVPMTVKESFHIAGLPTTWGLAPFKGWTPTVEATGVTRLKGAGAVILGKTNVPPSLGDWQSNNPIYGRTNNPYDLGRSPGGSSGGGAAALASGMVPLEFGSDIGGSIRIPAHFCGVFGHKPTMDLIPSTGHAPPSIEASGGPLPLAVVGPLARCASDIDLALTVLAGPDGDMAVGYRLALPPARAARLADLRVLMIDDIPICRTDSEVRGALHALADGMERAGARVDRGSPSVPNLVEAHQTYMRLLMTVMSRGQPDGREPISAYDWMSGMDVMAAHRRQWKALFEDYDVVIAPPFGTAAFPHTDEPDWSQRRLIIDGEATPYGDQLGWPGLATLPGLPATCTPVARTKAGLPIGVQVMGGWLEDRTTIAVAGMIEREFGTGA